jgi:hypothetical protein
MGLGMMSRLRGLSEMSEVSRFGRQSGIDMTYVAFVQVVGSIS